MPSLTFRADVAKTSLAMAAARKSQPLSEHPPDHSGRSKPYDMLLGEVEIVAAPAKLDPAGTRLPVHLERDGGFIELNARGPLQLGLGKGPALHDHAALVGIRRANGKLLLPHRVTITDVVCGRIAILEPVNGG